MQAPFKHTHSTTTTRRQSQCRQISYISSANKRPVSCSRGSAKFLSAEEKKKEKRQKKTQLERIFPFSLSFSLSTGNRGLIAEAEFVAKRGILRMDARREKQFRFLPSPLPPPPPPPPPTIEKITSTDGAPLLPPTQPLLLPIKAAIMTTETRRLIGASAACRDTTMD